MTERITTGQLVDKLKTGQKAKVVYDPRGQFEGDVVINNGNQFIWGNAEKTIFNIHDATIPLKWEIISSPVKYISFEEAKEILRIGKKKVICHWNGYEHEYSKNEHGHFVCIIDGYGKQQDNRPTWEEICYGKWTIKEESN